MLAKFLLLIWAMLIADDKWKNTRKIYSSSFKALLRLSEALSQLGKHKEALDFALAAQCLDPLSAEVAERVESIQKELSPETAIDMKQRYVGHCNVGTDIKQASFLGQNGDYVASGSDDGSWFIWEKRTGRLVKMLFGDEAGKAFHILLVNCIQCHPIYSVVASSGIDNTIKIWTPRAPDPSMAAGRSAGPEVASGSAGPDRAIVLETMEENQRRLSQIRETVLPIELLERFYMHDFTEGTLHPFECAQS